MSAVSPADPQTSGDPGFGQPSRGLLLQFLAWVAARPRTYHDTMDAWRTSCPRLSVWEDACAGGLVQVEGAANGLSEAGVRLTAAGFDALARGAGDR